MRGRPANNKLLGGRKGADALDWTTSIVDYLASLNVQTCLYRICSPILHDALRADEQYQLYSPLGELYWDHAAIAKVCLPRSAMACDDIPSFPASNACKEGEINGGWYNIHVSIMW